MEAFAAKVIAILKEQWGHADQLCSLMGQPVITVESKNVSEIVSFENRDQGIDRRSIS